MWRSQAKLDIRAAEAEHGLHILKELPETVQKVEAGQQAAAGVLCNASWSHLVFLRTYYPQNILCTTLTALQPCHCGKASRFLVT